MKRTIISICCILLAAVYPTAMIVEIVGIKIQRHAFKQAFRKSQFDLSKTEVVFLSHQDYEGQKAGDEFKLGANKYDVIAVKRTDRGYFITAYNDTLEKQLEIQLAENCKSNGNHPSKSKKSLLKIHMFCESVNDFKFKRYFIGHFVDNYCVKEHTGFASHPVQPPRHLS
jgi:hypothetical protein